MTEAIYDKKASFVRFVYPFLFEPANFMAHCSQIEKAQWKGQKGAIPVWKRGKFPNDELLSYVSDFLNPPENKIATARLWEMDTEKALQTVHGGLGVNSTVEWALKYRSGQFPFQIRQIHLNLFQIGVGFLILEVLPVCEGCSLKSWLDFVHFFRFIRGERSARLCCRVRTGITPDTHEPIFEPYFPDPCGGLRQHPEGEGALADIIDGVLESAILPGEIEQWHREVFIHNQLLPFEVLYAKNVPEEDIPLLTYQTRNFFRSKEGTYAAKEDLRLDHPALIPNAPNQWFFFSLDGGGYIAVNCPDSQEQGFFTQILPDHLSKAYFLLFILTLQQRFALMMLLDEVAENCPLSLSGQSTITDFSKKEKAFISIRDKLMAFTARGYFAQAMQREHHHRCYRKWQETFQVERLYEEVSDEIRYVADVLQTAHETTLSRIAWIIGVPVVLLTFIQSFGNMDFFLALGALIVGMGLGLIFYLNSNKIRF